MYKVESYKRLDDGTSIPFRSWNVKDIDTVAHIVRRETRLGLYVEVKKTIRNLEAE